MEFTGFIDAYRGLRLRLRERSAHLRNVGAFIGIWLGSAAVIPYGCCLSVVSLIILAASLLDHRDQKRIPVWVPAVVAGTGSTAASIMFASMRAEGYSLWQANMQSALAVMLIGVLAWFIVFVMASVLDSCQCWTTD